LLKYFSFPDAILVNFGGVAYYIDNSLVNWPDAKAICESIGTTLATFQTRPKYDSFVNGIFTLRKKITFAFAESGSFMLFC